MAKYKNTKYDESTLDAIRNLMNDNSNYYQRDVDDTDTARSCLSSFGFDEKDREYRGNLKPEISIPVLDSWMQQVTSTYTANPFGVKLESNKDITILSNVFKDVTKDIYDIAAQALVEELGVGYTYALVTNEIVNPELNWQKPSIRLVDARKVVVGYSEDPELDDCDIAIVIDVIDKKKAQAKYNLDEYDLKGSRDVLYGYDVIADTRNQCSVVTAYERMENGVQITKIVYNKIVDQIILPLDRLPIVRFYGDTVYIDKEVHYRGVYHKIADLWKLINYSTSEMQARIATAPTANYIVDPAAIAEFEEAWETGSDSAVLPSRSWNGNEELKAPMPVDKNLHVSELQAASVQFMNIITQVLGSPSVESRQNETAEAVLAKKSTAEATVNKYLTNLKRSLKSLGKVCLSMISIAYDVPRLEKGYEIPALSDISDVEVVVADGPIQATQKQKNLQQVLAFYELAKEANVPNAFTTIGPAILQLSDMPDNIKAGLSRMFTQPQQQIPPEILAQLQGKDAQIQQMQKQMVNLQGYIQKLEVILETEQYKIASQIQMNTDDNQTELQKQAMKASADNQQLQAKILADQQEAVIKATAEVEKARIKESNIIPLQGYTPPLNRGI